MEWLCWFPTPSHNGGPQTGRNRQEHPAFIAPSLWQAEGDRAGSPKGRGEGRMPGFDSILGRCPPFQSGSAPGLPTVKTAQVREFTGHSA